MVLSFKQFSDTLLEIHPDIEKVLKEPGLSVKKINQSIKILSPL